jgi:hypothetical protein
MKGQIPIFAFACKPSQGRSLEAISLNYKNVADTLKLNNGLKMPWVQFEVNFATMKRFKL